MSMIGKATIFLLCGLTASQASARGWDIPPDLWEKPRSGGAVRMLAPLRHCVETYLAEPGARILIHHADSEESLLRAEELRAWLAALAVEATRVELVADLKENQNLNIELIFPVQETAHGGQ